MARLTSLEADCDLGFGAIDVVGRGESLVTEWDSESILGVVIGEREGDLGDSGNSVRSARVGFFFLLFCGGGINWAGRSAGAGDFVFFFCFFFVPLRLRQGGWLRLGTCWFFLCYFLWWFFGVFFLPFFSKWVPAIPSSLPVYRNFHYFVFVFPCSWRWWWWWW